MQCIQQFKSRFSTEAAFIFSGQFGSEKNQRIALVAFYLKIHLQINQTHCK